MGEQDATEAPSEVAGERALRSDGVEPWRPRNEVGFDAGPSFGVSGCWGHPTGWAGFRQPGRAARVGADVRPWARVSPTGGPLLCARQAGTCAAKWRRRTLCAGSAGKA